MYFDPKSIAQEQTVFSAYCAHLMNPAAACTLYSIAVEGFCMLDVIHNKQRRVVKQ